MKSSFFYTLLLCCGAFLFFKCQKQADTPLSKQTDARSIHKVLRQRLDSIQKNKNTLEKIDSLNQLIHWGTTQLGVEDSAIANVYWNLGLQYYQSYQYPLAIKSYQKVDTIFQKTDARRYVLQINANYLNLGSILDEIGDYPAAINYYNQTLNYFINTKDTAGLIYTYKTMGVTYLRTKDPSTIPILEKGRTLLNQQTKPDSLDKADLWHNLGKAYTDCRTDYAQSLTYFKAAIPFLGTDSVNIAETYIEMAKTFLKINNYTEANRCAYTSLHLRQQVAKGKAVEVYRVLGDIAIKQQQPNSALVFYQKALETLDTTFKSNDSLQNPNIDFKTFNRKVELINVLVAKTGPLSILYQKTKNSVYLQAAFDTYQLADATVQVLRREMSDDQAKYFWNETALPIYRKGMDAAFQLYELTPDDKYKMAVLQFSERTKAPVLREGIADQQAKSFAGVPAQERLRERELKTSIAILEKKVETNSAIVTQLARIRTQLYAFQDSLKTIHPSYARYLAATFNDTPLPTTSGSAISINDLKNAQNQLSDSTLLIEYAFGATDLYTMALSKTDFKVFKNPISSNFNTEIDCFIHSVSDLDALKKDFAGTGHDYAATSFHLYEQLLKQPLSIIHSPLSIKRIHLVLEGKLHLLPFKALTDQAVTGWNGDYPKHFLVRRYAFGSLFSLQSLTQRAPSVSETQNDTNMLKLGCFGLDFKDSTLWRNKNVKNSTNKKNDVLANAEAEVYNIASSWHGDVYFKPAPTKSTFLKEAPQYDFLHITTHGYPEGLVFQKTNPADSSHELSIGDIYSLSLHTRFTFLSACETGQGKMTEAEGIMSLGRAFTLAGSQCVIMSLWSIPDRSTADIAQRFYTYYRNGLPKDVAEQKAEIDYLDNTHSDMQLHPNTWAALTIIGDMSPLETQPQARSNWVWWCLGGLVLLGLFFGFRKYL